MGALVPARGVRRFEASNFDRILRPAHGAGTVALARAVRPEGNRGLEGQSRQLRRGRTASAAAVTCRWRNDQTALVPFLATARRESPAGDRENAGRYAAFGRRSRYRACRRTGPVLGLLFQGARYVRLRGRPDMGSDRQLILASRPGSWTHGSPRDSKSR